MKKNPKYLIVSYCYVPALQMIDLNKGKCIIDIWARDGVLENISFKIDSDVDESIRGNKKTVILEYPKNDGYYINPHAMPLRLKNAGDFCKVTEYRQETDWTYETNEDEDQNHSWIDISSISYEMLDFDQAIFGFSFHGENLHAPFKNTDESRFLDYCAKLQNLSKETLKYKRFRFISPDKIIKRRFKKETGTKLAETDSVIYFELPDWAEVISEHLDFEFASQIKEEKKRNSLDQIAVISKIQYERLKTSKSFRGWIIDKKYRVPATMIDVEPIF